MKCSYCDDEVKEWKTKSGDIVTHICKECFKIQDEVAQGPEDLPTPYIGGIQNTYPRYWN